MKLSQRFHKSSLFIYLISRDFCEYNQVTIIDEQRKAYHEYSNPIVLFKFSTTIFFFFLHVLIVWNALCALKRFRWSSPCQYRNHITSVSYCSFCKEMKYINQTVSRKWCHVCKKKKKKRKPNLSKRKSMAQEQRTPAQVS